MAETIPTTMKALRKEVGMEEGYLYKDVEVPKPGEGEMLVKIERVAICGSDIPLYKWDATGKKIAQVPFTPGHETVGTVVKLGPGVTGFAIGDRVCAETHIPCHECFQCKHDQEYICKNMGLYGHGKKTTQGGFAQYATIRTDHAYKLKTNLDPDTAVLLEPFGVSHHAIEEVELNGSDILITGAGPIGIFCILIAKALGSPKVICIDINDKRLQLAKKVGADVVINTNGKDVAWIREEILKATDGDGVGCLIECTGHYQIVNAMFSFLRKGGRMVLVGVPKQPLHVEDVINDLHWKNFTLKSIHGRKMFHTWEESEKMLSSGQVKIDPEIVQHFDMSKYQDAFNALFAGQVCKIIVDPHK